MGDVLVLKIVIHALISALVKSTQASRRGHYAQSTDRERILLDLLKLPSQRGSDRSVFKDRWLLAYCHPHVRLQ